MRAAFAFFFISVLASTASAEVVTKSVSYEQGGVQLQGYLAHDDGVGASVKRPGVLVIPEWWGLNDFAKGRAEELAKLGYIAFAADMYGGGITTEDAKKAKELAGALYGKPLMAERAQAGLEQLLKTGLVNDQQVAAIGFCFGGSTCQALAYSGAPLAAIVSFHGGLIDAPAEALPKIHAKFLMLNGAVDPMVKASAIESFKKALESGHIDYQFISYSGAKHAFTNPDADRLARANDMTAMIGYNQTAALRSWAQMKFFFDELFAKK